MLRPRCYVKAIRKYEAVRIRVISLIKINPKGISTRDVAHEINDVCKNYVINILYDLEKDGIVVAVDRRGNIVTRRKGMLYVWRLGV